VSEQDKIDIIAAILTSGLQVKGGSGTGSGAAHAVVNFRRIKYMLTKHGMDGLPPIKDAEWFGLQGLLDLDKPPQASPPTS
jgi:hypothetical protein